MYVTALINIINMIKTNYIIKQEAHGPWCSAWEPPGPYAKVPEVAHILHFYLRGRNWAHFHSMSSSFQDTCRFSKLTNNCIWSWNLASGQIPEVAHLPSFYPRGANLSLFLLYGQRFPRYRPIFKIAIFGHETCQVANLKVLEFAHIPSF